MSELIVIFYLAVSLIFYCIFGGADFGAGILEGLFTKNKEKHRELTFNAIGPVWEANHIWLIITVVILFVGFPRIYSDVSVMLHIPLSLMLVGIVIRGCAFVFRHYDAHPSKQTQNIYSWLFTVSSIMTPLFFGICIGALINGQFPDTLGSFSSTYILPWATWFNLSLGIFTIILFATVASIFLIQDSVAPFKELRPIYQWWSSVFQLLLLTSGAIVFVVGYFEEVRFISLFVRSHLSTLFMVLTLIMAIISFRLIRSDFQWWLRVVVSLQITFILSAFLSAVYPNIVIRDNGNNISLLSVSAHSDTMFSLAVVLSVGLIVVLPVLIYLMKVFKLSSLD